jgi:hypothetical protein
MKETSLLRRFRWPLFIAIFSSAHVAGLAYLYGDTKTAGTAFTIVLCFACITVVFNTIDEQRENDRSRDNVMGEIMPPQEETEGGVG